MFVIYGRKNCIWCQRAKEFLTERGEPYAYFNIETDEVVMNNFKRLFPTAKSVPQIVLMWGGENPEYIGGYQDLINYLK